MKRATFRLYGELNDFLPAARRGAEVAVEFHVGPSVKDALEALGVPHPEVDLVLADGEPVDFGWTVRDGARVAAYPRFRSIDVGPVTRVRPPPPAGLRFVADGHLGRLARHLRAAGLDVRWEAGADDAALARLAAAEGRVLLTRDRGLLKRGEVAHGYCVRAADPAAQLAEVIRRFGLARAIAPFRRCVRCNEPLLAAGAEEVRGRVPPCVLERHDAFRRCPSCARVFWRGSHWRRMWRTLADALAAAAGGDHRA